MTNIPHRIVTEADRTYEDLLAVAPNTGRCPVRIHDLGVFHGSRPWEPASAVERIETCDPAAALARHWPGDCANPDHTDCMSPFGAEFPGLLPREPVNRADAVLHAAAISFIWLTGDLALVPAHRPADIPAAMGWQGMSNYGRDVVELSAVLRSWEVRFGAMLVGMSTSTLELAVAAPPVSEEECLRVAAEHIAFCCDAFETYTGQMSTDTLPQYAERLRARTRWRFWWD